MASQVWLPKFGFLISALVIAVLAEGFLRIARSVLLAWRGMKFDHRFSRVAFSRLLEADLAELLQLLGKDLVEPRTPQAMHG